MIEVKAESRNKDGERGVQLKCSIEGTGGDILNEALIAIRAIIAGIKEQDTELYVALLTAMALHKSVLLGDMELEEKKEEKSDPFGEMMSRLMSKSIIEKGVN